MEKAEKFSVAADLITTSKWDEREKTDARNRLMYLAIDKAHDYRRFKDDRGLDGEEHLKEFLYLTFNDYSLLKITLTPEGNALYFCAYAHFPHDDFD